MRLAVQVLTSAVRAQTRARRLQIRLAGRLADLHEKSSIARYLRRIKSRKKPKE